MREVITAATQKRKGITERERERRKKKRDEKSFQYTTKTAIQILR